MEFVRFPKTPHLSWLGPGRPRDDKVMSPDEARELLAHVVVVEEKVDGANIGLSVDSAEGILVQSRGTILALDTLHPQFRPLRQWLNTRRFSLIDALTPDLVLFGEWCYAVHSIHYARLPDWFLAFDVYDRTAGRFWSAERRDAFVLDLGMTPVPRLATGKFDLDGIKRLLGPSRLTDGPAEGLYVRWDDTGYLQRRAKLVNGRFTQAIGEHWSGAPIRPNAIVRGESRSAGPSSERGSPDATS